MTYSNKFNDSSICFFCQNSDFKYKSDKTMQRRLDTIIESVKQLGKSNFQFKITPLDEDHFKVCLSNKNSDPYKGYKQGQKSKKNHNIEQCMKVETINFCLVVIFNSNQPIIFKIIVPI